MNDDEVTQSWALIETRLAESDRALAQSWAEIAQIARSNYRGGWALLVAIALYAVVFTLYSINVLGSETISIGGTIVVIGALAAGIFALMILAKAILNEMTLAWQQALRCTRRKEVLLLRAKSRPGSLT